MRIQTWQEYVPDLGDNRTQYAAGEPAITVMVRPPTARVWWKFWLAVTESPKWSGVLSARKAEFGDQVGTGMTLRLAMLDESLAEILWLPSVGAITGLHPDGGEPVLNGKALWAIRDALDNADLYIDVLEAIIQRTTLEEGLASFLVSRSGPYHSHAEASPLDGAVAIAGQGT